MLKSYRSAVTAKHVRSQPVVRKIVRHVIYAHTFQSVAENTTSIGKTVKMFPRMLAEWMISKFTRTFIHMKTMDKES